MSFAEISRLFPLVLAPAVVALARRQKRVVWLDGIVLVWLAVCGAAVLWALLIAVTAGEAIGPEVVRRGLLMGLVAAATHTLFRKPEPAAEAVPEAEVPPVTVDVSPR